MGANSTYFGLTIPTIGGDRDIWGNELNPTLGGTGGAISGFDGIVRQVANFNIGTTPPGTSPNLVPIMAGTQWIDTSNSSLWGYSIYDGTEWVVVGNINPSTHQFISSGGGTGFSGILVTPVASNTSAFPFLSTVVYATVEIVGGGGGGGCPNGNAGSPYAGAGGGGGGYSKATFSGAQVLAVSQQITLGVGGAGAINIGNGSNGTASTFGTGVTLLTANGGGGAVAGYTSGVNPLYGFIAGSGGIASGGDIQISGQPGSNCMPLAPGIGGNGGASFLGGAGEGWSLLSASPFTVFPATDGTQGGGGGGGSQNNAPGGASPAGAGGNGYCIITQYLA